nr:uncharacterized protein LOC122761807 [Solea senegalensis]
MAAHRRPALLLTFFLSLWIKSGESYFLDQCDEICPAVYYTSTYDLPCIDYCDKHGYSYYFCHTKEGWDYCSPGVNVDYNGNECSSSGPCGKYGNKKSYECLSLTSNSLVQCGRVEPKAVHHKTINLKECISECRYHESGGYFWCYTAEDWDYCSPTPGITYQNVECLSSSPCGTEGQTSYSWCYTTPNRDWDYCGIVSPGECSYTESSRRKRQPNTSRVICTREDQNTREVTEFIASPGLVPMAEINNRLRTEALDLINTFDGQGLSGQSRSNLVRSTHFRIDNQGVINLNNQRYYNLQVQINRPRQQRESTTVANILAPVDTPTSYMRLGLSESLSGAVKVVLEVRSETGPSTSSSSGKKNKCCKRRKH